MKDALGNPIEVGKKYVYTLKSSGNFTVRTGIAKKINTKTITFEVLTSHYCYDGGRRTKESYPPAKAQVKSYALVPFIENEIDTIDIAYSANTTQLESDVAYFHKRLKEASSVPAKFFNNTTEGTNKMQSEHVEEYYKTRGY